MWKYQCKNQIISLLCAFALGVLLMAVTLNGTNYIDYIAEVVPNDIVKVFESNPLLIYIGGGLITAGLCNVFLIGNILSSQFGISTFVIFLILMMVPNYAIMIGVYTAPIMLIVSIYGYLSLKMKDRGLLKARNLSSDDEIIRIYTIHHPLQEEYKEMALSIRKQIRKIMWIYLLGIVAVFCVMFLIDNIFIVIIAVFAYMMCFQYLARYRSQCFMPIANLLYQKCDPEACMSALIYYSERRNNHYKLTNRALMANCMIYLDDPSLAQDILITFPRGNATNNLMYWSLMAYTYYLLKDEAGLYRCKEEIAGIKVGFGNMSLMYKTSEQNAIENKIRLMNRDFNACKQYYLSVLQAATNNLQKADAEYYIALISYVQEDFPVARLYFQRTIQIGNKLYFVRNARNYLDKINQLDGLEDADPIDPAAGNPFMRPGNPFRP